jgi:hypothetical protein
LGFWVFWFLFFSLFDDCEIIFDMSANCNGCWKIDYYTC